MKIRAIKRVGIKEVYDISVRDVEHYILKNGVVSHNTGGMYSANQVFIIGKAQEKDGSDIVGWNFTINIEKSRYVKEKSKFPFLVTYDKGISKWSGLLDLALESGHVIKPSNGWYQKVDMETGEIIEKKYRSADTNNSSFWSDILSTKSFNDFVEHKFCVSSSTLVEEDDVESVYSNIEDE